MRKGWEGAPSKPMHRRPHGWAVVKWLRALLRYLAQSEDLDFNPTYRHLEEVQVEEGEAAG